MSVPDVTLFQGWEQGGPIISLLSSGMGVSVNNAIVAGQYSRYGNQLQQNMDAASGYFGISVGTTNVVVARTYFALDAYPATGQAIPVAGVVDGVSAAAITKAFYVRVLADGRLEAGWIAASPPNLVSGSFTGSQTTSFPICSQRWYRLDLKIDSSANPWVADWRVNGVAQAQSSRAVAAATFTHVTCGHPGTGTVTPSRTLYTDDTAAGVTLADYPYGPGRSVIVVPDGFAATAGTGAFRDESGGGFSSSWWQRVSDGAPPAQDNVALASANDGLSLEMFGPFNTGNNLTFSFQDVTLGGGEGIACVKSWHETYRSSGSISVDSQKAWIVDNPTATTLATDTVNGAGPTNVSMQGWKGGSGIAVPARIAPPSGGWTQTIFNSMRLRWRSNLNAGASPSTQYHGLAWLGVEAHITGASERYALGCPKEFWGGVLGGAPDTGR